MTTLLNNYKAWLNKQTTVVQVLLTFFAWFIICFTIEFCMEWIWPEEKPVSLHKLVIESIKDAIFWTVLFFWSNFWSYFGFPPKKDKIQS
jgi:hypothetical protein